MVTAENRKSQLGKKMKAFLYSSAVSLALIGCAPVVHHHGYVFDEVELSALKRGETSMTDVTSMLGSPTVTSTVENQALYYISSRIESYLFYEPKETDRHVLALYFDENKKLTDYAEYGLKDGNIVAFVARETATSGRELSFLQQIFGNLGRVDGGGATGPMSRP